MHRFIAIAGLLLVLALWGAPAHAFQDPPKAPLQGEAATPAPKPKSTMAPMQLGSPATATDKPDDRKGFTVFGYKLMPKLDFGLDLLYSEKEPSSDAGQLEGSTPDETGDVGLLGKLRRRL